MRESCKSVLAGERYVIIVLVVLLMLRGEAVAHVRNARVLVHVAVTTIPTNVHSYSIT